MKKCPTCDKTFEDSMRFCQSDGTPLVDEVAAPEADPYATMVSSSIPEPSAIEPPADDPFKTMVAGPGDIPAPDASGDLLQIPESDPLKTMYVSEDELRREMASETPKEDPIFEVPPAVPDPPAFNEPSLSPPSFGDMAPPASPFGSSEDRQESSEDATLISSSPVSIPSPFDAPPADSFEDNGFNQPETYIPEPETSTPEPYTPATNAFQDPPSYKDPETPASPFGNTPFSAEPERPAQMEWTPPPAPDASWQNQAVGQNTPFQPPVVSEGQSQGLAIASLVCGVLSLLCCVSILTGPAGAIMGFIARKNANENPSQYTGAGLATAGMITGILGTVLAIVLIILQIFFGILSNM